MRKNNIRRARVLTLLTGLCLSAISQQAIAVSDIIFSGELIESAPCVVNNGAIIVVDFGNEMMTTRIDGTEYKKQIEYTLDCSKATSSYQKIRISTTSTSTFDANSIATGKTGLGIAIYNGTTRYTLGNWINFTDPALPKLYAVPVKDSGVTLTGGAFDVLASLVVAYQ